MRERIPENDLEKRLGALRALQAFDNHTCCFSSHAGPPGVLSKSEGERASEQALSTLHMKQYKPYFDSLDQTSVRGSTRNVEARPSRRPQKC